MKVSPKVKAGLNRLAFGNVNDALKLLSCDEEDMSSLNIHSLDLFNVSEIRKLKGGGFEIKFFDRLKALEKLHEYSSQSDDTKTTSLFDALEQSAAALAKSDTIGADSYE